MRPFRERLSGALPVLADGAMGTMLFARGLKSGDCPELWNLERPADLSAVARLYLEAGSEIVQTNTFGASPLKLAAYGLEGKAAEINRAGVLAARAAAGDRAYVSASCGPSGRMLRPYGDTAPEAVLESFAVQMAALAEAGADLILIETMTDLSEAVLAVQAARRAAPALPVAATMTFDRTRRGFFTMMGASIPAACERLAAAGADALGANCGNGIETMVLAAAELRSATRLPIVIQANAGLPEVVDGRLSYAETPEFFAEKARALADSGVAVVGGCCGTTPGHIAALRKMLGR